MKKESYYKRKKIERDIKKFEYSVRRKKNKKKAKNEKNDESSKIVKSVSSYKNVIVVAPEIFCLITNPQECYKFFKEIDDIIYSSDSIRAFVDMSNIKSFSSDAVMYLISCMKNLQLLNKSYKSFHGNMPNDVIARENLIESGFLEYVNSPISTKVNKNKMSIFSGSGFSVNDDKRVCDFITDNSFYSQNDINYLYSNINEMMLNTNQHAYNEQIIGNKKWYMSVEKSDDVFKVIFLDNGVGIPGSMYKKIGESIFKDDAELLLSAFSENRSITREINRGCGLISIRESVMNDSLKTMYVLSNKGMCHFTKNNGNEKIESDSFEYSLRGTLYYLEVKCNG